MAANLQSMYHYWKTFDLPELQKELDTTATELAARQDDSDINRKKLVEQSRDFKKNTPEDVRKQVAPLLKSFQAEIDSLSKRSKNAEGAFLSIYKRLIDAPDPGAVLEHALQLQKRAQKVQDLEIENKQLRETLEEYNHEFAEVKNQEVTIKNLRDKLKEYEDRMEASAQAKAKEKEKELQRSFSEKERQLQETQLSVAKKLGEAEHKVATLQSALDSTQSELFDLKAKYDEATSAKSDEMEMIMADLERANERAASAEREVEQLRQHLDSATQNLHQAEEMQKAPDMEQAIDILKRSSLEVELASKEKEIAQLVEEVQRLQATVNKLRDTTASQVAKLEEELLSKNKAVKDLEDKLKGQEDYEEIKRELSLLKSIEFGSTAGSDDSSANQESGNPSTPTGKGAKTLETLLLEKNRSLQAENTQFKIVTNDTTGGNVAKTPQPQPGMPQLQPGTPQPQPGTPHPHQSLGPQPPTPRLPSRTTPSTPSNNTSPITGTEMFASMLGQELVASYHLQNQLRLGFEGMAAAAHLGIPNGFFPGFPPLVALPPPPPPPLPPPQSTSSPATPLQVGHNQMASGQESPLERIHTIAKSEINNAQVLDTADVAQKIREVLSSNNIGQRLFAKHVLSLSQGTVSELLSKPKHWDKLTEKGRESYRKMALWAYDENNVLALKAIAPKKGNQPVSTTSKQEDSHTEERIAIILSEAQHAMEAKQGNDKNQAANAMVASIYQQELVKLSQQEAQRDGLKIPKSESKESLMNGSLENGHWSELGGPSGRGRKPQTDSSNLTQEMVTRIYRDELVKLAQAAEQSGNLAECHMYRQELIRLSQNMKQKPPERPASQPLIHNVRPWETIKEENKENHSEDYRENGSDLRLNIKKEPHEQNSDMGIDNNENLSESPSPTLSGPQDLSTNGSADSLRHTGSAFCLVRPRSNSQNSVDPAHMSPLMAGSDSPSMSPLQRMQNIANSLMAKNNAQIQNQRPLRAVLPPIAQEEFDKYSNINTDDLVKQIKDSLSQFSISQRLFGENVLGLSQGSVSDLLARPKPWHMLTQKGREPFIRMQLFLEDGESIPRLVATQYRIPPEKLLRSKPFEDEVVRGSLAALALDFAGSATATYTTATTSPPTPILSPQFSLAPTTSSPTVSVTFTSPSEKFTKSTINGTPISSPRSSSSQRQKAAPPPPPTPPSLPPPLPPLPPTALHPLFPHPLMVPKMSPPNVTVSSAPQTPTSSHPPDMPMLSMQPSVFEIAAMTNELDTVTITIRVKEVLQYHNLGQKLFGEAVLGLSQGSVSELLSKPKPWHMLSLKGREPFIKMHMWLSDPFNVDRLRIYQNELKDKQIQRCPNHSNQLHEKFAKRRSSSSAEDSKDPPVPNKKPRVYFSEEQKESLRQAYGKDPYPNQAKIEQLADSLGVGTKTIVNWFHNHRMRNKSTNSPSLVSPPTPAHSTKSEPEDLSNHSDHSQPGIGPSMAQWMFPSFEPVAMNGQFMVSNPIQLINEKAQDLSVSRSESGKRMDNLSSNGTENGESPRRKSCGTPPVILPADAGYKPQCTVNKRKSSRPKWVYEGTQLDRSLHEEELRNSFVQDTQPQDLSCRSESDNSMLLDDLVSKPAEEGPESMEVETLTPDNNNDKTKNSVNVALLSSEDDSDDETPSPNHKTDKTLRGVESAKWENIVETHGTIDKLATNLQQNSDDWEF